MSTPKIQIKPCPFCGGEAKRTIIRENDGIKHWSCGCANQSCHGDPLAFGDNRAEAIANWNYRAELSSPPKAGVSACPFCGKLPERKLYPPAPPEITQPYWMVMCVNPDCKCSAMISGDTDLEAIYHWNQRAE